MTTHSEAFPTRTNTNQAPHSRHRYQVSRWYLWHHFGRQRVSVCETTALDELGHTDRHRMIEYRSVIGKAVELPSFTSSLQRQRIATAQSGSPIANACA